MSNSSFSRVMAVAIACLPIFRSGFVVSRANGALFLGGYGLYLGYLVVAAKGGASLPALQTALMGGLLPLLVIVTVVLFIRDLRRE